MEKSFSIPNRITTPISYVTYFVPETSYVISDVFCSHFHSCPCHLYVMFHCLPVMYFILTINIFLIIKPTRCTNFSKLFLE